MNHSTASAPLAEAFEPRSETETRLHGYWLVLVRLVCLALCVLSVGLFVAGILSYIANHYMFCTGTAAACHTYRQNTPVVVRPIQEPGLSINFFALYPIVLDSILSLGYWLVAAFLFWRKSDDRVALLAAVTLGIFPIVFNTGLMSTLSSSWSFLTHGISFLGSLCFALFFYVFPSGHFVPRWTRWVFVVTLLYGVFNTFFPFSSFNPFYTYQVLNDLAFIGVIVSIVVIQIYRYWRVSSPAQRQQTKWVVYGMSMGWGGYLALLTITLFFPSLYQTSLLVNSIADTALYGFILLVPFFIGVAILRSRLWDIDILINRTLVYGCLSVCVVGVYVLVVGALGALIGTSGNLLISLVATGLVAVLFQPLRALLQRGVNRLLYGQRDEPYTVITRLSRRLEGTLAPDAVLSTIVETVAQALKLPYVAILLKHEDTFRLAASAGALVGEPLILPLVYQQDAIGQLRLAPRTPGEPFTPADRRLLDELVRQAGLAAHALQLRADLQRSYEQLEQRAQERTRELSTLLEVSHNVASMLELKPLLNLILNQIKGVVEYTAATILILDGDELVIVDYLGPVPREGILQVRYSVRSTGIDDIVLRQAEPVIIDDVRASTPLAQDYREAVGDMLKTFSSYLRALMVVPLKLKDRVIGMLSLDSSEVGCYMPHHASLILAIASQAAIAIENARLYEQAQALAAVEERQKLARELHDSVSQALYGIALGLHTARIQLDRDPGKLPESLDDLLSLADSALAEMRALIFELRPESLESKGLVAALARQGAALQARHDIIIQTDLCEEPALPLKAKQELYRIAQEALQNTVKHAHASRVVLRLEQTADGITMEVRDDGVGFDTTGSFPGHLGLHSMRERVANLGGTFEIVSTPGAGARISVCIPVYA